MREEGEGEGQEWGRGFGVQVDPERLVATPGCPLPGGAQRGCLRGSLEPRSDRWELVVRKALRKPNIHSRMLNSCNEKSYSTQLRKKERKKKKTPKKNPPKKKKKKKRT